jgi:hypothetical protein
MVIEFFLAKTKSMGVSFPPSSVVKVTDEVIKGTVAGEVVPGGKQESQGGLLVTSCEGEGRVTGRVSSPRLLVLVGSKSTVSV